jgi:hypothetical protein
MRRDVDQTGEFDFVAHGLEPLGNLKCDNTAVTVTGDGIWSRRLGPLDCCGIARHHLVHGGEEGVAGLEATSTESVEGALVLEVLGEVDENQNLSNTRVDEEDGRLVSSQLEGNDGVVLLSLAVLGEQCVDIVGEA